MTVTDANGTTTVRYNADGARYVGLSANAARAEIATVLMRFSELSE